MAPYLFQLSVPADGKTVTQALSPAIQPDSVVSVPGTVAMTGSGTVTAVASGEFTSTGGPAVSSGIPLLPVCLLAVCRWREDA